MKPVAFHLVGSTSQGLALHCRALLDLRHWARTYDSIEHLSIEAPDGGIVMYRANPEDVPSDVLRQLAGADLALPIVFIDEKPSLEKALTAIRAGATDYAVLPFTLTDIERIVEFHEEDVVPRTVIMHRRAAAREQIAGLTQREREVLEHLAEGHSNKSMALALNISPRTVEIHRSNMMWKLGADHSAQAVRIRMEAGYAHCSSSGPDQKRRSAS